jgi:NAD(P)-dependent dehydrogenase (short-subunit alcohol dehydrogenase family)
LGRPLVQACLANKLELTVLDLPASMAKHPLPAQVRGIGLDATSPASVAAAFEQIAGFWPHIDHMFFMVGFTLVPAKPLQDFSFEEWERVQAGNLRTAFLCCKHALPLLLKAPSPSIVTVASGLGVNLLKGFGAYGSAKAGLIGLTKALATEHAPKLRANAVAPGAVLTAFMGGGTGYSEENQDDWKWFTDTQDKHLHLIPLGRLAVPEDIAGPILFLASESARFITGQTLHINGGRITP